MIQKYRQTREYTRWNALIETRNITVDCSPSVPKAGAA